MLYQKVVVFTFHGHVNKYRCLIIFICFHVDTYFLSKHGLPCGKEYVLLRLCIFNSKCTRPRWIKAEELRSFSILINKQVILEDNLLILKEKPILFLEKKKPLQIISKAFHFGVINRAQYILPFVLLQFIVRRATFCR